MTCRGVHFAITAEQAEALLATDGDEVLMQLIEAIEEAWDKEHLALSLTRPGTRCTAALRMDSLGTGIALIP